MNSAILNERLRQVEKRKRDLQFWCKLGAVWAAAGLLGLGVSLLERRTGWSSSYALPAIALLGLLSAGVVLLRRKQLEPDWREVAARVETCYPELDGRLLTAVQQHPKNGETTYLQERLLTEVLAHGRHNDWAEALPLSRLRTAQTAHLLALLLFAGSLLGLRVTRTQVLVSHDFGSGLVEVSPGDTNLESGTPLVVLARFNGPLPANVDLVMDSAGGTSRRMSLTRSLADPVFGGSAPEMKTNLVYHLEYAGKRSRDFRVGVFEYPHLERADATLTFPEYTGQPAKRIDNTRRVSAVQGSLLDFALQLNKPVASAQLVLRDKPGPPLPLETVARRPAATLTHFPLETNATYKLELRDAEGRTNKVPAEFVFNVLPNRRPEIHLAMPRGDLRPSPLEEVLFSGTVWDDFGVKAYGIGYAMVGQPPQTIQLGSAVPGQEKRSFQHVLRLEELGVEPDQLVSWFVWADDVGPDGQVRRTTGDLYFAEVRPFEEVFREGQGMDGQESGGGGGGGGSPSGKLADLEKQIISATWNLQRKGDSAPDVTPPRRNASPRPNRQSSLPKLNNRGFVFGAVPPEKDSAADSATPNAARTNGAAGVRTNSVASDPEVVRDAQAQALEEAEAAMSRQRDQRATALWSTATRQMEQALEHLNQAGKSTNALDQALTAEQAAYQSLLKLQEHEYQVSRSRNRNQRGSGREQQMQRQLEQMDLTQSEDRYETLRQAQTPQAPEQREQLQLASRLQELARRQQDLNERLQELQTALQEARTEQEREEIRRRLKRLEEEEQQMLADIDEVQQRMDRPENQSQMAQQRQQLEQTRNDVQRAAEAASQGLPSQALASGTRAQRQLQQLRDEMRQQTSSQFANDLREMRNQARELSRQQEELGRQMEAEAQGAGTAKSLSDSPQRQAMLNRLAQQKQQTTNLIDRATQVSQQAEQTEPLLSEQLYDTIRKFTQDTSKALAESQDELINSGQMTRSLYEQLKESTAPDSSKMFDLTTDMVQRDLLPQAQGSGQRMRAGLENLKRGVEHAAESVLGDDTQALRLAREELNKLAEQLQQEIAQDQANAAATNQATGAGGAQASGTNGAPSNAGELGQGGSQNSQAGSQDSQSGDSSQNNPSNSPGNNSGRNAQANSGAGAQGGSRLQPGALTQNGGGSRRLGVGAWAGGTGGADISGSLGANWDRFLDTNATPAGPLTGDDFVPWSESLREVEQMVDQTDLRNQVATARERARLLRQQFRTDRKKPDWAVVKMQVLNPLVEVRDRIAEELARRESRENLAPLDRDPVPARYSDLVRRYYEELGKGQK
jgi:hypothetical protein